LTDETADGSSGEVTDVESSEENELGIDIPLSLILIDSESYEEYIA
jgi:hypothetical protein